MTTKLFLNEVFVYIRNLYLSTLNKKEYFVFDFNIVANLNDIFCFSRLIYGFCIIGIIYYSNDLSS